MATVWFVKEGGIQVGPSIARKPVDWCVKNLGLQPSNWIAGSRQEDLTIGQKTTLGAYADYRFVIVEIDDDDVSAGATGWKLGYYLLEMGVPDARRIIDTVP